MNCLYLMLNEKSDSAIDLTSTCEGKLCSTIVFVEFSMDWNSHLTRAGGNLPLPSMSILYTSSWVYPSNANSSHVFLNLAEILIFFLL